MRLGHFRLEHYGPFEQLDVPFDPRPGRINLVVAPNGYGKSVIRRSIGEFLFGIEARTPMSFRFGTERMRILADVVHDGTTRPLIRRKGNGNTLAVADGAAIPPDEVRRLLGGADETVFRELFGLDTSLLRLGGRDLIRSQGRLGQVLFAAGGGMGRVRGLLSELEEQRDEFGKATARHKTKPLWKALSCWEQASLDLRRSALKPDGWQALERQAVETAAIRDVLLREQAEDASERERLRTIGACRPWLGRLQAAALVLADAQDAPNLDEGFEKRWRDALQHHVMSASAAEAVRQALQAAREARAALRFDPAWIAAETDIKALVDLRGVAVQCEIDLPAVQHECMAEQAKAVALRSDLGWDATVGLPPVAVVRDAQRRLRLHPALADAATATINAIAAIDRELADTEAELAGLPDQGDITAIADLVQLLRADGNPAIRLDSARRNLREAEAALCTSLAAIPDCPLAENTLTTTAAPSEPRLEAAGKALSEAEIEQAQAVRDHASRTAEIDRQRTRLAALEQTAMLPSQGMLAETRARRDGLWSGLCGPQRADPAAAVAFDRAMRDADAIADALIAHGQEVAEAAALRSQLAALEAVRAKQAAAVASAASAVAEARAGLLAMARAAGGNADDVAGLRTFLRARDRAVENRAARDAAASELAALETALGALGGQLATAMNMAPPAAGVVGVLLAEADRRIEAQRQLAATRRSLVEQAARQRAARAAADIAAQTASRALADWDEAWSGVKTELARPEAEAPAVTAEALGQIEDLRKAEATAADKQHRIDGMLGAIDQLATKVARLSDLSPAFAVLPPIEAAEALRQRVQAELREAARCQDAEQRIEQEEAKLEHARAAAESAVRTLAGLRAALRVDSDEAAEHQLQRARAVAAARTDRAEALRHLAVQGGGLSIEALTIQAAATPADADIARISEIEARHEARLALIDAARDACAAANSALEQASIGTDAAEAAQRREAAQATVARLAEEALVLHATQALLRAALDRQASGTDQPLLVRIGDVFHGITGGAQAGVRIEETKDGQTMVALEADGDTRRSLDQLSEGTSDQLYLALRVAALEDYAASASPLPFVADDVLQTFDDPRTAATMRALLALSERVQVIVLTHHTHVGALAARLPEGAVRVIQLEARSGPEVEWSGQQADPQVLRQWA